MPLSWRSFFTVVWFLSAISDKVSPCLMVTLFTLDRLLRLDELLRFVELLRTLLELVELSTSTKERLVKKASELYLYIESSLAMKVLVAVVGILIIDGLLLPLTISRRYCGLRVRSSSSSMPQT